MSKRALDPSPHTSSSPSSPSRSRQRRSRFQPLLHALPAALLSTVCSFLTVHEVVSTLRSTSRALQGSLTPDCLLRSHLVVTGSSLPALLASKPSTRALVSRIPSLTLLYRDGYGEEVLDNQEMAMLALHGLRSPQDASRFLFSGLSSLYVVLEDVHDEPFASPALLHSCLLSVMLLLATEAESFRSLRSLVIDDGGFLQVLPRLELPFSSLARLPALTHCDISLATSSALSTSSLLSALSSLQSLTSLELGDTWPQLLPLLCADAATPLLLRLQSLLLPPYGRDDGMDELHNAFLCRLSALPAPPALQRFRGVAVTHRAAGLRSLFSLPHLRRLDASGSVRTAELSAITSSFISAPAPLTSLVLPGLRSEPDGGGRNRAALLKAEAVAVRTAVQRLLSRFTTLRHLDCDAEMVTGAAALPDSRPGDGTSGCSGSLYSLDLRSREPSRCRFIAALSFPLLTELTITLPMKDAELQLLLPGCPQLLRLDCVVSQSWNVLLIAARCCRGLLELTVHTRAEEQQQVSYAAVAAPQLDNSSGFLPELVTLTLYGGEWRPYQFVSDFSVLRHFAAPPYAQLQHVYLHGRNLTAQHVLPLAGLPRLSFVHVSAPGGSVATLEQARRRTRRRLRSRGSAAPADCDDYWPMTGSERWRDCVHKPPLGPHQRQEMRQRVLEAAARLSGEDNLLAAVEGVDADTARSTFFAELRSLLTGTTAKRGNGRKGRG